MPIKMPDDRMTAAPPAYKPKPPLWRPAFEKRTTLLGILAGAGLAVLVAVTLALLPGSFLSVPMGQVEVQVVRVVAGTPAEGGPASFRHIVSLADGSERPFVAEHLYRPGDRLVVTASRGRLTGRISLDPPYRVLSSERASPSEVQEAP
jgi:hypothetical protein